MHINLIDLIISAFMIDHVSSEISQILVPLLFYYESVKLVTLRVVVRLADFRAGIANPADVVPAFRTMDEGTSRCRASMESRTFPWFHFAADKALVTCPGENHQPTAERRPAQPQGNPRIHVVLQSTSSDQSLDSGSHEPWYRKRN